ncbi:MULTISPECIES: deoxynucleoside kinase [unclassified Mesorhizobium]|uniref:deoxynucleoside kinase n=1 Tax=unclassified Mesorhizobium TaxID=325217 RepID=UPI0003D02BFD|nr:deoxynucleoside kinase [Mesorhizobium sp. LSJC268A00]ESZ12896.1 hypothetical protein X735_21165 [Mesorhizobium sp. L2C085B000]
MGVFGAGKSTLAKRFGPVFGGVLAEDHTKNSFWGNDAAVGVTGYLPYDLNFLLQHVYLVASPVTIEGGILICDWSFLSDYLWASLRLQEELEIYAKVYGAMTDKVGPPIGYVYLKQPPETIISRLMERGREAEVGLLDKIVSAALKLDHLVATLPPERVYVTGDDPEEEVIRTRLRQWRT